jgi:hypothetical protein
MLEPTGPGREDRVTRAECLPPLPHRTPCPRGRAQTVSPPPVRRHPYLQPRWDERARSRPTYQWPNSLPQSPRGFASSSFSLLSVDGTQITHVTGVPSVFQHGWCARQAGRDQPPQGGRTLQDHTIPFLKGNRTIPFLFWRATANKVEEFPGRIVPRRRVSVRPPVCAPTRRCEPSGGKIAASALRPPARACGCQAGLQRPGPLASLAGPPSMTSSPSAAVASSMLPPRSRPCCRGSTGVPPQGGGAEREGSLARIRSVSSSAPRPKRRVEFLVLAFRSHHLGPVQPCSFDGGRDHLCEMLQHGVVDLAQIVARGDLD